MMEEPEMLSFVSSLPSDLAPPKLIRSYFPETWLWDNAFAGLVSRNFIGWLGENLIQLYTDLMISLFIGPPPD